MPISLFDTDAVQNLETRLSKLTAETTPQWGKMTATEMLNHCAAQMEIAMGKKPMKTNFLIRLFAKYIKRNILAGKPTTKNSPTAKELLPTNIQGFAQEKAKLLALIHEMYQSQQNLHNAKHPFFGNMTADEYGKITWNHLDYHFGQFGL
jgi:hypothetical protein